MSNETLFFVVVLALIGLGDSPSTADDTVTLSGLMAFVLHCPEDQMGCSDKVDADTETKVVEVVMLRTGTEPAGKGNPDPMVHKTRIRVEDAAAEARDYGGNIVEPSGKEDGYPYWQLDAGKIDLVGPSGMVKLDRSFNNVLHLRLVKDSYRDARDDLSAASEVSQVEMSLIGGTLSAEDLLSVIACRKVGRSAPIPCFGLSIAELVKYSADEIQKIVVTPDSGTEFTIALEGGKIAADVVVAITHVTDPDVGHHFQEQYAVSVAKDVDWKNRCYLTAFRPNNDCETHLAAVPSADIPAFCPPVVIERRP